MKENHHLLPKVLLLIILCSITLFAQLLPDGNSTLFSGSGNCAICHAQGIPNPDALSDSGGRDISPPTLWRGGMMANAARDPYFQAKVSAEVAEHPALQALIENKCITCHAPLGHTEAHYLGTSAYFLADMQGDPLAMDGVSCTSCHQIKDIGLGEGSSFSGQYTITDERIIYGPYHNPISGPMQDELNYEPRFGDQVNRSELCATCHTLFTPTLDNSGQIIGELPEQTPFLEWENSLYPAQDIHCQTCHMPITGYPVAISNRPPWLYGREPFYQHHFVGGNIFMQTMLKTNAFELGVTAEEVHFDSTIARTLRLLQHQTIDLNADYRWLTDDTLSVKVAISNRAGHKFPTGFPSRRAWIYLSLTDDTGQKPFESGSFDPLSGEIIGLDSPFEHHHDIIKNEADVQIYQSVMGDVDDNVTYVLLRGHSYLKDNRLPPAGFTTQGSHYDSTKISGHAADDPNFNRTGLSQGSGVDTVTYHVGGLSRGQSYRADVKVFYQSVAPRFAQDLFRHSTAEIQRFQGYYSAADKQPVTVKSQELNISTTGITRKSHVIPQTPFLIRIYPNPFNPATRLHFTIMESGILHLKIFNLLGEPVKTFSPRQVSPGEHIIPWVIEPNEALASGVYLLQAQWQSRLGKPGGTIIRKVVLLR